MGRGTNVRHTFDLSPLPSSHDQRWLADFIELESAFFHTKSEPGCEVVPPYGTPRFTAVSTAYPDPANIENVLHTFSYYASVNELLQALLLAARTSTGLTIFEYDSPRHAFKGIKPRCLIYGYVPARVQDTAERINQRISRVRAIKTRDGVHGLAYNGKERFLYIEIRESVNLELYPVETLQDVEQAVSYLAASPYAFSSFYDLDVSDQPIPLRFAFRYTDDNGNIYEVSEPEPDPV